MPVKKIQLTTDGLKAIHDELNELKTIKQPAAIDKLQKARSMGDLAENSAYTAAREELSLIEGRILEIEEILKNAEIINLKQDNGEISVGKQVVVEINNTQDTIYVVGEYEADPMNKKLSNTSPIGKALIGKKVGDIIEVEVPSGKITYKILEIR